MRIYKTNLSMEIKVTTICLQVLDAIQDYLASCDGGKPFSGLCQLLSPQEGMDRLLGPNFWSLEPYLIIQTDVKVKEAQGRQDILFNKDSMQLGRALPQPFAVGGT